MFCKLQLGGTGDIIFVKLLILENKVPVYL